MRVLFITNYYPPHEIGGYEQLCRDMVVQLMARGHTAAVLTSVHGLAAPISGGEPNIHRRLRVQLDFESHLSPVLQFFFLRRGAEAHNRRCLRAIATQFAPDVIFVWNVQGLPRTITLEAESIPNTAVAYWLAGYTPAEPDEFWQYWSQPPAIRSATAPVKALLGAFAKFIMRAEGHPVHPQMQHVAVVSEYFRRRGLAEGTLPLQARVIYNGVEIEQFVRPVRTDFDSPLRLLQAGRVCRDKGVHTAVEAVGQLVRDYGFHDIHLDIVGNGPTDYLAFLQQLVKKYQIEDYVSLLGWLPREAMPEVLARCQVLLLPTIIQEAFARVVLEAMAGGLVVIGTPTGGTLELLHDGTTGLVFTTGDSDHLARQIKRLIVESGLRQRLATQGQQLVLKRFSLTHMTDEIEDFLGQACRAKSAAPLRAK